MKYLTKALLLVITLCVPFFLLMGSIKILISPSFLHFEYSLPNFPADDFGFTKAERLKWGIPSLKYLINNETDDSLGNLRFEDGTAIYNERELEHMLDVRNLVKAANLAWYLVAAFLVLAGIVLWKLHKCTEYWNAVSYGGWLTFGLILAVIAGILFDFTALFTGFHAIFFEGDTWLFFANDTLIRLYPEKLWSDAFIYMGGFTLVGALVIIILVPRLAKKCNKRQDFPAV